MFRGKEVLTWSINNYLGLSNHPEVRKVDAEASKEWGLGYPMGARMMSGQTKYHEELEKQLAEFVGKEDAFLLNFGYQGFMSVIDALVDRNDCIVYDSECHACIIDGVRMHQGKRFVFQHNDIDGCRKQLERATKLTEETGGGILLITEGVFGMSGDQGKLKEIVDLRKNEGFKFRLLVTMHMVSEHSVRPEQAPDRNKVFRMRSMSIWLRSPSPWPASVLSLQATRT